MHCITFKRINTVKKKKCKRQKKIYYIKLRLTEDYQYDFEEEQQQQTNKKPNKKELPKNAKRDDLRKLNEWVNENRTGINHELFKKYFNFQRPSGMLKGLYITNDKKKSNNLVIVIKSRLSGLKEGNWKHE